MSYSSRPISDHARATCRRKIRFNTKEEARRNLYHFWQTGRGKKMPVRYYKCYVCNGYHLTHWPYIPVHERKGRTAA